MRVVFVAPFGLRKKTTVWARTLPLAQALANKGWEPTILIPPWDSPQDSGTHQRVGGVEVLQVKTDGGIPATVARLLRATWGLDPEIVHIVKPRAHAGLVQWLLYSLGAGRRRRLVLDIDDWEQAWAEINHYTPAVSRFLAWQEEWGIRHAGAITAASRWLVQRAHDYAPATPCLYLPNGVTLPERSPRWTASPDGARPTVLFFTRYVEVTPAWLAELAQALRTKRPAMRLLIAGEPLRPEGDTPFRNEFTTRNLTDPNQFVWLGRIAPETLPALYAASSAAVFPAHAVPLQLAKCSVRLATTLLNGLPVVASDVGEQSAYGAGGAAELVDANASPARFADAVLGLIGSPERCQAMVGAAHAHLARSYQWRDLGARLASFYRNLLET